MSSKEIHISLITQETLRSPHKKGIRTNYRKLTLAKKGTEVWNNLPKQYKEPRSDDLFKSILKKYCLQLDLKKMTINYHAVVPKKSTPV